MTKIKNKIFLLSKIKTKEKKVSKKRPRMLVSNKKSSEQAE